MEFIEIWAARVKAKNLTKGEDLGREYEMCVAEYPELRKKDGVFYTPAYITTYIIEETLGVLCREKEAELDILTDENLSLQALDAYRNWLFTVTVLDPACGSGAFLNQVLNFLLAEHSRLDERRSSLQGMPILRGNYVDTILKNNIYGVDLNDEAVGIAKLSLWLRTAERGQKLSDLSENIVAGNSLVDDKKISNRAFNWQKAFPKVFKNGGFDMVVGNPPYVDIKALDNELVKYLFKQYNTTENRINLYSVFIEKGYSLVKENGFLSFINPNSILMNSSYSKIRTLLREDVTKIVKLPDNVFPDAQVETIIFEVRKGIKCETVEILPYLKNERIEEIDNTRLITLEKKTWSDTFNIYAGNSILDILNKIEKNNTQLIDLVDITLGITPYDKYKGHSEMTIKNRDFHSKDKKDSTYQPLITGENITRYYVKTKINEYIKYGDWLGAKREERFFTEPRILIRQIISGNPGRIYASYTDEIYYFTQIGFGIIPKKENLIDVKYLLVILNSNLMNFYHKYKFLDIEKNLFQKILIANCKQFPIKNISTKEQQPFIDLANEMLLLNKEIEVIINKFTTHLTLVFPNKLEISKKIRFKSGACY